MNEQTQAFRPQRLSREAVRQVDARAIADYGMSGLVLMENAGRGCAEVLLAVGCSGPVAIVCGKGNNAGDGFVIARHLQLHEVPVKVILLYPAESFVGDAAANYHIVQQAAIPCLDLAADFSPERLERELQGASWIVDAMLGTGATGSPRFPLDAAIGVINRQTAKRLAVDLPSGLDCDSGQAAQATVLADHTCTFVAHKLGFEIPSARSYLGQIHVIDIGVPRKLLEDLAASAPPL